MIIAALNGIKNKGMGLDGIPAKWIKIMFSHPHLTWQLTHFALTCFKNCIISSKLKNNRLFFLYKNSGLKFSINNYHTISVACALNKILENTVLVKLKPFMLEIGIPRLRQFCAPGRSAFETIYLLIKVSTYFLWC